MEKGLIIRHENKTLTLDHTPYLEGEEDNEFYVAMASDIYGGCYNVKWIADHSNGRTIQVDWDKPFLIKELVRKYQSVQRKRI